MSDELAALCLRVQQQGELVKALNQQHHDITNSLVKERGEEYRLQQELKGKQRANQ